MKNKVKIGLDLTRHKIKKFDDFVIQESASYNLESAKISSKKIGLDLTNNSHNKIDLTKYGEDIE